MESSATGRYVHHQSYNTMVYVHENKESMTPFCALCIKVVAGWLVGRSGSIAVMGIENNGDIMIVDMMGNVCDLRVLLPHML